MVGNFFFQNNCQYYTLLKFVEKNRKTWRPREFTGKCFVFRINHEEYVFFEKYEFVLTINIRCAAVFLTRTRVEDVERNTCNQRFMNKYIRNTWWNENVNFTRKEIHIITNYLVLVLLDIAFYFLYFILKLVNWNRCKFSFHRIKN